jgi:hypothetical protein
VPPTIDSGKSYRENFRKLFPPTKSSAVLHQGRLHRNNYRKKEGAPSLKENL